MAVSDTSAATADQNSSHRAVKQRAVNITGRGADVAFVIDEHAPIEVVARDLGAQLSGRGALFSEGGVSVNTGGRVFSSWEKAAIRRIFQDNSGLRVSRFISSTGEDLTESEAVERRPRIRNPFRARIPQTSAPVGSTKNSQPDVGRNSQRNRNHAMVVTSTFRSGESLRHYGDVVVLGDVNPGSEIMADGDIVVMGSVKGLVHAGATGDNRAAIIALEIAAPRLRIGDCEAELQGNQGPSGRRGRMRDSNSGKTLIAYTRRGGIFVSPFTGRFARYTKGVPYDG